MSFLDELGKVTKETNVEIAQYDQIAAEVIDLFR